MGIKKMVKKLGAVWITSLVLWLFAMIMATIFYGLWALVLVPGMPMLKLWGLYRLRDNNEK